MRDVTNDISFSLTPEEVSDLEEEIQALYARTKPKAGAHHGVMVRDLSKNHPTLYRFYMMVFDRNRT